MVTRQSYELVLPKALRSEEAIRTWAEQYSDFERHKDRFIKDLLCKAAARGSAETSIGYLTLEELLMIDSWKSFGRNRARVRKNTEEAVINISGRAFGKEDVYTLTELSGIGLATASGIMHFVFPQTHPVIDVRALATLGVQGDPTKYWPDYKTKCCEWADDFSVDLRTLDRALWQYDLDR